VRVQWLRGRLSDLSNSRAQVVYKSGFFQLGDNAKELYDTAQLEEKQFNKPHATNFIGDRRRTSRLALRQSGEDSFGRVGESVSADARWILGLAREPAAEAVVGFQITDLPFVGHGILQHADQAHSYRWARLILGFIELSCELVGGY
jgi:hypothetical protein